MTDIQLLHQRHVDKLADIIWWIKGAIDTHGEGFSFDESHLEALIEARLLGMQTEDVFRG